MGSACGTYGGKEWFRQGFGGETCGKEPLGRLRRKWENNIKIDLQELEWEDMNWIYLAEDRENAVMNPEVL